ncbi:MAG: P-loop containing nucleoside triphosphate hydrolase protein [Monoraphidium minutum]|nr:MAG: P-loop containing nucleoside triphosphate hydrolase protein [Monoraphidium minutum]
MEGDDIVLFRPSKRKLAAGPEGKAKKAYKPKAKHPAADAEPAAPPKPERALGEASTSQPAASDDEDASFKELGVTDWLCSVLQSLGITRPTPVQRGCIPAVLAGRDVIGTAQTGSGKTAAFALPILQTLVKDPYGVFALVLTPTRELAVQLAEQFRAFGAGMSLRDCVVIGGVEQQAQAKALARRPHVVIATPGRLAELVDTDPGLRRGFAKTRFLVLDEADRLLDPTFEAPLRSILGALPTDNRQTLLFSATMTQALVKLQSERLAGAHVFQAYTGLQTAEKLRQEYVFVPAKGRPHGARGARRLVAVVRDAVRRRAGARDRGPRGVQAAAPRHARGRGADRDHARLRRQEASRARGD